MRMRVWPRERPSGTRHKTGAGRDQDPSAVERPDILGHHCPDLARQVGLDGRLQHALDHRALRDEGVDTPVLGGDGDLDPLAADLAGEAPVHIGFLACVEGQPAVWAD